MIANLKGMPFGVKSLEKRQNDLIGRLFPNGERVGVNATRLAYVHWNCVLLIWIIWSLTRSSC